MIYQPSSCKNFYLHVPREYLLAFYRNKKLDCVFQEFPTLTDGTIIYTVAKSSEMYTLYMKIIKRNMVEHASKIRSINTPHDRLSIKSALV